MNIELPVSRIWWVVLAILVLWNLWRQVSPNLEGIFSFSRRKARKFAQEHPSVTFDDVAGDEEAKEELRPIVDFLRQPEKYRNIGARISPGVLMVGPLGTGKTLLARAVAGESHAPFFSLDASEFGGAFISYGASRLGELFAKARSVSPSIVFIAELDAIGRLHGFGLGAVNDEREQILNQLLVEMDGFNERHPLIILAATNHPDALDPALLRPGRFDHQIMIGLPDRQTREGILRIHTRSLKLENDVALDLLARTTPGFNGANLANLCNEAALIAVHNNHQKVGMEDFEEAFDRLLIGATHTWLLNDQDRRWVAYHEAGHALAAWLMPAADPIHKITIIPHGWSRGGTELLPGDDRYNYSKSYLFARLAVLMAGRVAEEIAMGEITNRAEKDLLEATRLARRMVTRWGMGALGSMAFTAGEQQPYLGYEMIQGRDYSEETAARIDADVQRILEERLQFVKKLLLDSRENLDKLANALLHEETLDQARIGKILGECPAGDQKSLKIAETIEA